MKMKIIIALIAFVTTFGTSTALTGLFVEKHAPLFTFAATKRDPQTQQRILALLRQDIKNGDERFGRVSCAKPVFSQGWLATYSVAVSEYQAKSASINDSDLPADFQAAWRDHMQAWLDHAVFVEQLKESAQTGEMTNTDIKQEFDDEDNDIDRTWNQALRVADKYSANPYKID